MKFHSALISILLATALLCACGGSSNYVPAPLPVQIDIDFNSEPMGWVSGISDFSVATMPTDMVTEYRPLPAPLSGKGLYAFGTNRSDDLFIYIKKRYSGFAPNTGYTLRFQTTIVSNVASGCFGVGGSPGDSVWLFAGASSIEPQTIQKGDEYVMNIDRGGQSGSGKSALVLGTIGNASTDCGHAPYMEKKLANQTALNITTDASGNLWLLFGFDSGFESASHIYFKSISVQATPLSN